MGGRVNFIHCIVDGNLSSADVPVFFYNCIFRGGSLGEKTLTFHSAEIRNTILTGGHITLKNKGGIIFKDCSSRTSKSSYSCFNIWPTRTDGTGVSQIIFLGCNISAEYNVNYCDPNKYSVYIEQSHYFTASNVISVEAKNNSNLTIYGVIKKDITISELTFLNLYSEVIEPGTKINVYPSCVVRNNYGLTLTPVSDPKIVIF